jgi:hypothetical protein
MNESSSSSSIGWFLIKVLTGLAGLGLVIGFVSLQLQVGNITVIIGDKNKVENGDQSQTVIQPAKPVTAEAKTEQPVSQAVPTPSLPAPTVQATTDLPRPVARTPYRGRARSTDQYESDEDCTCPLEADAEAEAEPEPQPRQHVQTRYTTYPTYPTYVSNPAPVVVTPNYSQYQTQTQSGGVYVQSSGVTVRTSSSGQKTHTRVVINGQVVVDE